jgi:plastocyanin
MKTGKLKWYYQVVHHDLWDADIAIPPILFSTTINGQTRNGIAAMRADGTLFLLDRATGKPLVPVEERPVPQDKFNNTSPTQPFPVGAEGVGPSCDYWKDKVRAPFVLECGFAPPYTDRQNVLAPGYPIYGVNRVTPMAFSPQTGYFYALGTAALGRARRISKDPWFRGSASMLPDILPPSMNVLTAIDSRTDKTVWRKELPQAGGSGPLTTAGGLLFRGDPSGAFQAFDAKTGDKVWEFQTGLAGGRAPAAAYAVGGEEYLALVMGPSVFAFKLDGALPQAQTRPPVQAGRGGRGGAAPADTITEIQVATLVQSAERGVGDRWAVDEDTFNPVRARVKANQWFAFTNNGTTPHTIVALDGSFNTGTLKPGESGSVKLLRLGTVRYTCKEHPWAIGELTVE